MRNDNTMSLVTLALPLAVLVSITGCLNIGPRTIVQDRFNYNVAIRDSWEEQILMNVVSLRYGEAPVFLDIDSVITQYSLEATAGISGGLNSGLAGDDTIEAQGGAVWSERPTITYTPVRGREFTVNMLTPIQPSEIFAMIEAGWNAERSLRVLLKSINGLTSYEPGTQTSDPRFFNVLRAFKVLQDKDALGIRREVTEGGVRTYVFLRDVESEPSIESAAGTLETELNLSPEFEEFELVSGFTPEKPDQIAISIPRKHSHF